MESPMETLISRGAEIRYSDTRKSEGSVFVRIHMTVEYTEVLREAMGWEVGTVSKGELVPKEIAATRMWMVPDDAALKDYALDLPITEMGEFNYFVVRDKEGHLSHEVRFIVVTIAEGASQACENYLRYVPSASQLRVNYKPPAVQQTLPLQAAAAGPVQTTIEEATEEELDTGCIQCNNEIPLAEGNPKVHASGAACTRKEGEEDEEDVAGAPLAPASAMRPRLTAAKQKRTRLINEKKGLVQVQ